MIEGDVFRIIVKAPEFGATGEEPVTPEVTPEVLKTVRAFYHSLWAVTARERSNKMKILGVSGSPRKDETSGVNKLVRAILENAGVDYELVSLRMLSCRKCPIAKTA